MNRFTLLPLASLTILMTAGGCYTVQNKPMTDSERADQLARGVVLASGGPAWPRVTSVSFTFAVRDGGDLKVSRTHLWDVKANTDTISSGDKTTTIDLAKKDMADPGQADAFKAWTNDSYWLLAPLKLFDGGVMRKYGGRQEVNGKTYEVLQLAFQGVGMTPGDQYNMYVDPLTSLVAYWDYMPNEEMKMRATWEQYRHLAYLKLATFHQMGTKTITIENLKVASE